MDWHIMTGFPDGNRYRLVFHIPVQAVDNDVGRPYSECLAEAFGADALVSVMPFITPAEQALLDAGELYEVMEEFSTHPGETLLEKRARIDARYTARWAAEQGGLQERLRYWGYGRNVP